MKSIFEGLTLFQRIAYPRHRELFERLAGKQTPQAVFVACSDSRVVPNLLVQAEPGDLFIVRNAGNIVPPAGSGYGGTIASLEYAIFGLGIRDVILCGHSNCGAMKGVLHPEKLENLPAVRQWVGYAEPARRAVEAAHPGAEGEEALNLAVEYNVIAQVRNILTYPRIRPLVERNELELYGWVYDIATGTVRGLDASGRRFVPLGGDEKGSPDERHVLASVESDEEFWGRL
ncbi:MAG TPA: carbonic anhydrase [Thermoanaerobaculia bacterium]|nr:carbonic anhydrase [Thermoanaerobaculia bacterium]HQR67077.1 carbonic anhydrase [Thermoanaerobaculia bacterium]